MVKEKLTNRQIKALETKDKIYQAAIAKFSKHGMDQTSIQEICREAGVSIGSFYNHFDSKEDIIYETFRIADTNFEQFKIMDEEGRSPREIILEYMNYYIDFVQTNEFEFVKKLYNTNNHHFVTSRRPMQEVLKKILRNRKIQVDPYFARDSDDLVDMLFMTARGVIFHWCLKEGYFDLNEVCRKQIEMVLASALKE
ncbi:MAG TPA: hypothetical protein DHM90_12205 [Clostridiaceae bacterium]|jgi:AcrR family transcriptional regulator|nr:hypothetical protein [Clostridiaceae bacterium]